MEGKELHDDDDNLKSDPRRKNDRDDDFGLPDASGDSGEKEEENEEYRESSFEYASDPEPEEEPTGFGEFEEHTPTYRYTPEEERKKSPTGLIVFLSILGVLIIMLVIYWFFIRSPQQPRQTQPVISEEPVEDTQPSEPVMEQPVEETEPVVVEEEPEQPETGTFETINTGTGRYYIVLNSFFDEDLAADYAGDLAEQGISTYIIGPPSGKGFNRVVIDEDYGSWNEAENRMSELKGTFGEDIWVLKY